MWTALFFWTKIRLSKYQAASYLKGLDLYFGQTAVATGKANGILKTHLDSSKEVQIVQ